MSLADIGNSIAHSTIQLATALPLGAAIDYMFDSLFKRIEEKVNINGGFDGGAYNPKRFIMRSIEAGAQIVLTGTIVGAFTTYLAMLPFESGDPSGGAMFIILIFFAQKSLRKKLGEIVDYGKAVFLEGVSQAEKTTDSIFHHSAQDVGNNSRQQIKALQQNVNAVALH